MKRSLILYNLFSIVLLACSGKKELSRYYQNNDTKLLSKHNGLHRRLKQLVSVETRQTYDLHNPKKWEDVPNGKYWISLGPVSNADYREFIEYTRDSIAHELCSHIYSQGQECYKIDWSRKLEWEIPSFYEQIDVILTRYENPKTRPIPVNYQRISFNERDCTSNTYMPVYPDTVVIKSLTVDESKNYFLDETTNNCPVYGISQQQASAYCKWLTDIWNSALQLEGASDRVIITLPAEEELNTIKRTLTSEHYKAMVKKKPYCVSQDPETLKIFATNSDSTNLTIQKNDTQFWYIIRLQN